MRLNLLGLEPLLVARLTAGLAGLDPRPHVLAAPDLAGVLEEAQLTPAVHVVYHGMRPGQLLGDGKVATVEQEWLTVAAVRNVRQARQGGAAREDAGLLLGAVWETLAGWRPPGFRALRPAPAPRPAYTTGFIYQPLAWVTTLQLRAADDQQPS